MKKCVMVVVAMCACVLTPMVGVTGCGECTDSKPTHYTRQDLANEARAVPSVQSVVLDDGSTMDVTLNINMASLQESVQQAVLYEMWHMEWVQSAQACLRPDGDAVDFDATLSVVVTRPSGERDVVLRAAPVRGFYVVDSTELDVGRLEVYERELDATVPESSVDVELRYVTQTGRGSEAVLTLIEVERVGEVTESWDYSGN